MQTLDVAIFIHAAENIYNLCFSWNHKKTLAWSRAGRYGPKNYHDNYRYRIIAQP